MGRGYRWDNLSKRYRAHHPLCVFCEREGRIKAAELVDHIIPLSVAPELMWQRTNLQSLCKRCHDTVKQQQEFSGFHNGIDASGWPSDPNHPANGGAITTDQQYSIPHHVRRSRIPVHLVCGPPGSGKTTYVRKHKQAGDIVIDFDDIRESICGERYSSDPAVLSRTMDIRDRLIRSLANRYNGTCWLIVMAPSRDERAAWVRALGRDHVTMHVMPTSKDVCKRRIMADPQREQYQIELCSRVDAWFRVNREMEEKNPTGGG